MAQEDNDYQEHSEMVAEMCEVNEILERRLGVDAPVCQKMRIVTNAFASMTTKDVEDMQNAMQAEDELSSKNDGNTDAPCSQ